MSGQVCAPSSWARLVAIDEKLICEAQFTESPRNIDAIFRRARSDCFSAASAEGLVGELDPRAPLGPLGRLLMYDGAERATEDRPEPSAAPYFPLAQPAPVIPVKTEVIALGAPPQLRDYRALFRTEREAVSDTGLLPSLLGELVRFLAGDVRECIQAVLGRGPRSSSASVASFVSLQGRETYLAVLHPVNNGGPTPVELPHEKEARASLLGEWLRADVALWRELFQRLLSGDACLRKQADETVFWKLQLADGLSEYGNLLKDSKIELHWCREFADRVDSARNEQLESFSSAIAAVNHAYSAAAVPLEPIETVYSYIPEKRHLLGQLVSYLEDAEVRTGAYVNVHDRLEFETDSGVSRTLFARSLPPPDPEEETPLSTLITGLRDWRPLGCAPSLPMVVYDVAVAAVQQTVSVLATVVLVAPSKNLEATERISKTLASSFITAEEWLNLLEDLWGAVEGAERFLNMYPDALAGLADKMAEWDACRRTRRLGYESAPGARDGAMDRLGVYDDLLSVLGTLRLNRPTRLGATAAWNLSGFQGLTLELPASSESLSLWPFYAQRSDGALFALSGSCGGRLLLRRLELAGTRALARRDAAVVPVDVPPEADLFWSGVASRAPQFR